LSLLTFQIQPFLRLISNLKIFLFILGGKDWNVQRQWEFVSIGTLLSVID